MMDRKREKRVGDGLEEVYLKYNRREYVHPDPLEFLFRYPGLLDREIAGLVASGLAYGRVTQILASIGRILDVLGPRPASFLADTSVRSLRDMLAGFRHRFTDGAEVAALLSSASSLQAVHGSLGEALARFTHQSSFRDGLDRLAAMLLDGSGSTASSLLPRPCRGSACKRLNLYARWMVRKDDVDPGGWDMLCPADLVVPLDVHMHRAGLALGFTCRKSADCRTAEEITEGFRRFCPEDPVRYDFALTRYGILGLKDEELFRDLFG